MLITRNRLIWCGIVLSAVGVSFLVFPPYEAYCESNYPDNYYCAAYGITVALGGIVETYNGAITALATVFIGAFTGTIYKINKSQLVHGRQIERAYVSGGATIDWERTGTYTFGQGSVATPQMRPRWLVITVNNHGKTPADVTEIAVGLCDPGQLPAVENLEADYGRSKRLAGMKIAPGTNGLPTKIRFEFSQAAGKIVYGRHYYTDIFGDSHSTGFVMKVLSSDVVAVEAPPEYSAWD